MVFGMDDRSLSRYKRGRRILVGNWGRVRCRVKAGREELRVPHAKLGDLVLYIWGSLQLEIYSVSCTSLLLYEKLLEMAV